MGSQAEELHFAAGPLLAGLKSHEEGQHCSISRSFLLSLGKASCVFPDFAALEPQWEHKHRVWAGAVEVQRERLSTAEGVQLHKHLKGAHQDHLQKQHLLNLALFDLCPHSNNGRATESSLMCLQCNKVTPVGIKSPAITVQVLC